LQPSYGEPIDLTIYRCVQESSPTRSAMPGGAGRHRIRRDRSDGARGPEPAIQDDGRGIDPAAPIGRGLRGMQERVQAWAEAVLEGAPAGARTCDRDTDRPASRRGAA
jgi:two-component system sensor histidine kinase UhpB